MHCSFNDKFAGAGLSDPGLARKHNEDRFVVDAAAGLLMVADGVGGHNAGALASTEAVAAIRESLGGSFGAQDPSLGEEDITLLDRDSPMALAGPANVVRTRNSTTADQAQIFAAVKHANDIVHGMNRMREFTPETDMGTTILGLQFRPGRPMEATIFHVGDSRLYLLRDDKLVRITRDHSAYEQWLEDGETGPMPSKNIILKAIGPVAEVAPSLRTGRFLPGDLILLCTDGLNDMVGDNEIHDLLASVERGDLTAGCQRLIDAANANGGADNATVVLGAFADSPS